MNVHEPQYIKSNMRWTRRRPYALLQVVATSIIAVVLQFGAQGAVTFVDLVPDVRTNLFNVDFNIDLNGDGTRDVWLTRSTGTSGLRVEGTGQIRIQSSAGGDPGTFYGVPIPPQAEIGAAPLGGALWVGSAPLTANILSVFVLVGSTLVYGGLFIGQDAYLGLEMTLLDGVHYAYLHLEVPAFDTLGIIKSYAFETTPGVPIVAGSVPEPGRTGLILGALLAALLVRRRAVAAASRARRT